MLDFGFYNMDCMDGMREFPDKYFDLAVCDPPYGIGMDGGEIGYKRFNVFDKKSWDKDIPSTEYFQELFRVSKKPSHIWRKLLWSSSYALLSDLG